MKMHKMATVFVLAVLTPTLVLAWLAIGSLRDQEMIANTQRAILHQSSTEALAGDLNTFMDDVRVFFRQLLDDLIEENGTDALSFNFDRLAPQRWSQCATASVVTDEGEILCPSLSSEDPGTQLFIKQNAPFLLNQANSRFYEADSINMGPVVTKNRVETRSIDRSGPPQSRKEVLKDSSLLGRKKENSPGDYQFKVEVAEQKLRANPFRRMSQNDVSQLETGEMLDPVREAILEGEEERRTLYRNVLPSQSVINQIPQATSTPRVASTLEWGIGNLATIVEGKREGAVSRFLQDGLHVMLWSRHEAAPGRIFWVELDLDSIKKDFVTLFSKYSANNDICLSLLDEEGRIVAKTAENFSTDWSQPFVASEVGQILPHWEVAAYLLDPHSVNRSARVAKLMIWLLVPTLLLAIGVGTFLIFRAVNLEMRLARQKTDFVSNVSHELRTPLTSIRMFSDLLTSQAKNDKDREYSGIISREAARLTRLINDLLDFSRLERSDQPHEELPIDLRELTGELVSTYRMQLESDGCRLIYSDLSGETSLIVKGDRDALSQVLLNLLSNAEKYGCPEGEIEVKLYQEEKGMVEWQVLDQGPGVDRKHASRIFDKFYRADDSLTNPVQGSGLGLTLAKRIVSLHGGEIGYRRRSEGGSCFYVRFPLVKNL